MRNNRQYDGVARVRINYDFYKLLGVTAFVV